MKLLMLAKTQVENLCSPLNAVSSQKLAHN